MLFSVPIDWNKKWKSAHMTVPTMLEFNRQKYRTPTSMKVCSIITAIEAVAKIARAGGIDCCYGYGGCRWVIAIGLLYYLIIVRLQLMVLLLSSFLVCFVIYA